MFPRFLGDYLFGAYAGAVIYWRRSPRRVFDFAAEGWNQTVGGRREAGVNWGVLFRVCGCEPGAAL
jgi:hypothetical protein